MPLSQLDQEIKCAERDKYIAETETAKVNKDRIEYDLNQNKKYFLWRSLRDILKPVLGFTAIVSFITYILIPSIKLSTIKSETASAYKDDSLRREKDTLESQQKQLARQKIISLTASKKVGQLSDSVKTEESLLKGVSSKLKQAQSNYDLLQRNININAITLLNYKNKLVKLAPMVDSLNNIKSMFNEFRRNTFVPVPIGFKCDDRPVGDVEFLVSAKGYAKSYYFSPIQDRIYTYIANIPNNTLFKVFIKSKKYRLKDKNFEFHVSDQTEYVNVDLVDVDKK